MESVYVAAFVGTLEHTAGDGGEDMSDSIEEEELGGHRSLDKHDHAGGDDCQETDDIQDTDTVEDDIAWAGQRLGGECHLAGCQNGVLGLL